MLTDEQVAAIEALRVKYPGNRMDKFAIDPRAHEAIAVEVARGLGLENGRRENQFILDLGCGFGYFSNVSHAVAMDLPNPMIRDALGILGMGLWDHEIETCKLLPGCFNYDLITMFGVNLHNGMRYWNAEEYSFLAADVRFRLHSGGAWVIRPNAPVGRNSPTACLMDRDWWQKVTGPDAEISTTINYSFQVTIRWKPST